MKRVYVFAAGVALGVAATRRTRRAREAARAALAAKLTPSAIAADLADAIAEVGQAIGSLATDVRIGAANRRAVYRPMVDGITGSVVMVPPTQVRELAARRAAYGDGVAHGGRVAHDGVADATVVGAAAVNAIT